MKIKAIWIGHDQTKGLTQKMDYELEVTDGKRYHPEQDTIRVLVEDKVLSYLSVFDFLKDWNLIRTIH